MFADLLCLLSIGLQKVSKKCLDHCTAGYNIAAQWLSSFQNYGYYVFKIKIRSTCRPFTRTYSKRRVESWRPIADDTDLNRDHGVATATVQRACDLLEQESLIERRNGSGVFVAKPVSKLTGNIGYIGSPAYTFQSTPFHVHLMGGIQQALEPDQHLLNLGGLIPGA